LEVEPVVELTPFVESPAGGFLDIANGVAQTYLTGNIEIEGGRGEADEKQSYGQD
jgi:hypothetical protein